jgi:hypothetical protein
LPAGVLEFPEEFLFLGVLCGLSDYADRSAESFIGSEGRQRLVA